MRGAFITLEGIDGSGKTTQARLLAERLRAGGRAVELTREPGGTEAGRMIRTLVLSRDQNVSAEAELFLYLADRAIHVHEVVRPALARGHIVICERYTDSTLAYQGYGRGLDLELLGRLNDIATAHTVPDLTLVLDLPPERAYLDGSRLDRLESEGKAFSGRVAAGFRDMASREPNRVKVIDASGEIGAVHAAIMEFVQGLLSAAGPFAGESPGEAP